MIGTVLIVDDVATNRIVLKVKLGAAGYRTLLASDGPACLDLALQERPDLILLDVVMPGMDGIEVLRRLRADPRTARIGVVMVSAFADGATRLAALRAGADEVLAKPFDDQALLARLRSLSRAREVAAGVEGGDEALGLAEGPMAFDGPGTVALVLSRPEAAMALRKQLAAAGGDRVVVIAPDQVFGGDRGEAAAPDAFLIEAAMGEGAAGLKLMSALQSRAETRHVPVSILLDDGQAVLAAMAFDLGAADVVEASLGPAEIALRLHGLIRRKREGERLRARVKDSLRLAVTDPLTGLPNRRYGLARLAEIAERSAAGGCDFALMVLDLDRFKSVNDRFGHAAGDKVLVEVSHRLATNLRAGDLIARIGGEEFLVCLPDTTLAESQGIAQRLCNVVKETPVRLSDEVALRVTVSIGLAMSHEIPAPGAVAVDEIFLRADHALLASKGAGRNKVTLARTAA